MARAWRTGLASFVLASTLFASCADDGGADSASGDATAIDDPDALSPPEGATTPDDTVQSGCASGRFPDEMREAPRALFSDAPPTGYFVWWDKFGWHVRVIAADQPGDPAADVFNSRFSGSVLVSGDVSKVEAVEDPETAGSVIVGLAGNEIPFAFSGASTPTGFDFIAKCNSTGVRFELNDAEGNPVFPGDIRIGRQGVAIENPIIAEREP